MTDHFLAGLILGVCFTFVFVFGVHTLRQLDTIESENSLSYFFGNTGLVSVNHIRQSSPNNPFKNPGLFLETGRFGIVTRAL